MISRNIHTYYSTVEGRIQTLDDLQIEDERDIELLRIWIRRLRLGLDNIAGGENCSLLNEVEVVQHMIKVVSCCIKWKG